MIRTMDVVRSDNEEMELLASSLDAAGVESPLLEIGWLQGLAEGLLTAEAVFEAAERELGLS